MIHFILVGIPLYITVIVTFITEILLKLGVL